MGGGKIPFFAGKIIKKIMFFLHLDGENYISLHGF